MKRSLIITVGIVVILLVLGLWVFLLIFGAPEKPQDVFSDLGIIPAKERPEVQELDIQDTASLTEESVIINVTGSTLQQLTTNPIAGFGLRSIGGQESVRYVELGTGHIYEIDLITGKRTQISRTTIPNIVEAIFSPDAATVVLISDNNGRRVEIGEIPRNIDLDIQRTSLPPTATNIAFENNETILYTQTIEDETTGHAYTIDTQETKVRFSVEIADMAATWGEPTNKIYVYTKPSHLFDGFVYEVHNGILSIVNEPRKGAVPFITPNAVLISAVDEDDGMYKTTVTYTNNTPTEDKKLPVLALPEKCAPDTTSNEFIWCAAPVEAQSESYLEDWYKGVAQERDLLWHIRLTTQSAEFITDFTETSGRAIDVTDMERDELGTKLFFRNKIDNTLWFYSLEQ